MKKGEYYIDRKNGPMGATVYVAHSSDGRFSAEAYSEDDALAKLETLMDKLATIGLKRERVPSSATALANGRTAESHGPV